MDDFTNVQLDVAALPKLEEVEFSGLNKKHLTQILLFRAILVLALFVFLAFIYVEKGEEFGNVFMLIVAAALVFALSFLVLGYLGFFRKGFALREKDVNYKRGLIFHTLTTIPLNRIQHSELVRGPFDRIFGLSSVKIYTAGGSTSDVTIPGLTVEVAENVREFMNTKIAADATV